MTESKLTDVLYGTRKVRPNSSAHQQRDHFVSVSPRWGSAALGAWGVLVAKGHAHLRTLAFTCAILRADAMSIMADPVKVFSSPISM